jgi:hypothetical protein
MKRRSDADTADIFLAWFTSPIDDKGTPYHPIPERCCYQGCAATCAKPRDTYCTKHVPTKGQP